MNYIHTKLSKILLPFFLFFIAISSSGQGFSTSSINWPVPTGGNINSSGVNNGFFLLGNSSASGGINGSQNWSLFDINGDGKQDLVVTSEKTANGVEVYSVSSNPYWKVYLNTGTRYAANPTTWYLPTGGIISSNNVPMGFNSLSHLGASTGGNGSQNWNVIDINGDGKPDLVVTSEKTAAGTTAYSPSSNSYWKVFLNTGSRFSASSTIWYLPVGGEINGSGINNGFDAIFSNTGNGGSIGSQNWDFQDMNGDGKGDLVVTSELNATGIQTFSPSNPYWKVFLNTGTRFASTATTWNLPTGGQINGSGVVNGFYTTSFVQANGGSIGAQNWELLDLNGDGKKDLAVTSEKNASTVSVFSPTSNPYWKVYINTGSRFGTIPITWLLPSGGHINSSGLFNGFYVPFNSSANGGSTGAQNWGVFDMNADGKQDLVVTSERFASSLSVFGQPNSPYWKVFINDGTRFSANPINWTNPSGGNINGSGVANGFYLSSSTNASIGTVGSQNWSLLDINGDNRNDLVVTSEKTAASTSVFNVSSSPYWKVFYYSGPNGTLNIGEESDITIYPNPSSGKFSVSGFPINSKLNVQIFNSSGQLVLKQTQSNEIDLSAYPKGIYFVLINDGDKVISKKLVVE